MKKILVGLGLVVFFIVLFKLITFGLTLVAWLIPVFSFILTSIITFTIWRAIFRSNIRRY